MTVRIIVMIVLKYFTATNKQPIKQNNMIEYDNPCIKFAKNHRNYTIKFKDFITIIESARITTRCLNKIHGLKINIDFYTRGLIESAYIFLSIDQETKCLAYKHFNIECLSLDLDLNKEQKQLEQEIDFELGERKHLDFLEQQEEIRATQKNSC